MAMQRQLWSLNALSNELGMDRRTLAKRLHSLAPAETKQFDNRTEKLWHMADVVSHLQRQQKQSGSDKPTPINGFRMIHEESIKHFLWWLTDEMAPAWTGLLKTETTLDADTIKRLYGTSYALIAHHMQKYLCEDTFNKALAANVGHTFDQLHHQAFKDHVISSPPQEDEIELKLPTVIADMMGSMVNAP